MSATRGKARAGAMPAGTSIRVIATNLPMTTTLGDLEGLVQPKVSGRITAISLQGAGSAHIEFASILDAEACLGEHVLEGTKVQLLLPGEVGPVNGKRPRSPIGETPTVHFTAPVSCSTSSASPTEPAPLLADALGSEPTLSSAASSSSTLGGISGPYDGSALMLASAPVLIDPALAAAAEPIASVVIADGDAAVAPLMVAAVAPPPKKARGGGGAKAAQSAAEKEKRLNRVGLSYRCGRCGLPKKGHVCTGVGAPEGADGGAADAVAAAVNGGGGAGSNKSPLGSELSEATAAEIEGVGANGTPPGTWDLDSESIFKDIKSVLQTPAGGAAGKAGAGGGAKASGGAKRQKKRPADKAMPPPPVVAGVVGAERTELLEELDIALQTQRPPSVITPDDSDSKAPAGGPSSLGVPPSSLVSASDMFSPGQLMTHLLGTPTPAITPGLSPGTLNELGNMLQSPSAALASAKKAQEAAAEATGILETPGP